MSAPLLVVDNLHIAYRGDKGDVTVVKDFSLTLGSAETYGLVGESGSGKSTAAFALLGYLAEGGRIVSGSIKVNGAEITTLDEEGLRRLRGGDIAMVYQEPASALNPVLTIGRQLVEARLAHRPGSKAQALADAADMLTKVSIGDVQAMLRRYPHQLSGGQAQRVVIAMALLAEPKLLVLDEPTTGLDATVEAGVVDLIGELARKIGMGLLYISHNLALVGRICERVGVMYAGRVVEEGSTRDIFGRPRHPYTQALIACRPAVTEGTASRRLTVIPGQPPAPGIHIEGCAFVPRCPHAVPGRCDQAAAIAVKTLAGNHFVRCARADDDLAIAAVASEAETRPLPGPEVIRIEHLSKAYLPRNAFGLARRVDLAQLPKANDDISLSVRQSEILSVVGESGSGKSTLARILIGLEEASEGRVLLLDQDVARRRAWRRPRSLLRALQMVFQNPDSTLNPSHKVGAIIGRAVKRLGQIQGRQAITARVDELLAQVQLPQSFVGKYPHELSGGQRQRVGIARAFAGEPDIIIADEPVSALDVSVQAAIVNLLLDMQREAGTTFVFISHDLALVRHISDRVVVMFGGRIMEIGRPAEIFAPPYHPYTEALLQAAREGRRKVPAFDPAPPPRTGCRYAGRCPRRIDGLCEIKEPPRQATPDGHVIFCHLSWEQFGAAQTFSEGD
ncbi:ABC transporter ATP-binding protein [Taklimakanibacter albus]|uniref:ABC transporter ATP-binding protein n=1 Tax=Taklimakanibacter albus TaxID=2800327 RepID=A0ACC5R8A1_9HYPH|nr:ABC transporter ATP-binding protein [Aestuariivirga sp. YIM B02566]MBK1868916.1 ABC transporter ATP-binding protein [Aestuariivirga sp. YIM B02566]